MASTTFVDQQTIIVAAWLNDVNTSTYTTVPTLSSSVSSLSSQVSAKANAGANSDITSLNGLSTALSIAQGGTGASTASGARTSLGLGSAATLTAGTSANNVVQLDGTAKLPAVDGSQLTNLPSGFAPPIRQTILGGPVDTNGLSAFGGSTGTTTVTTSGTLTLTAANGVTTTGNVDKTFQITNPSWTSLSTNGTMYLYVDWNAGTPITGSTTLAPIYQWGGTYSTTSNQHTFNIQEMIMKVGNGSVAAQTYRVFVGEVTVAGGVTTAITWYALMGRFESAWTNTLVGASATASANHNIGVIPDIVRHELKCLTTDNGYAVGDILTDFGSNNGTYVAPMSMNRTYKTIAIATANSAAYASSPKTGGNYIELTAANWAYRFTAYRGW